MSFLRSFSSLTAVACLLLATSAGCGGIDAEAFCEKADACGNTPSAESVKSCKESIDPCRDESDDFASCADGNLECVEGKSKLKEGHCESEFAALFACALKNSEQTPATD